MHGARHKHIHLTQARMLLTLSNAAAYTCLEHMHICAQGRQSDLSRAAAVGCLAADLFRGKLQHLSNFCVHCGHCTLLQLAELAGI